MTRTTRPSSALPGTARRRPLRTARDLAAGTLAVGLAATLAACSTGTDPGADETAPSAAAEGWSWTSSGYGTTYELDEAPDSVVVDGYSAAALWDYGVRPAGVFGYGFSEAGALSIGNAQVDEMEVVGADAEFNLEKLLALEPDLVIGFGNEDGTAWTWWEDKVTEEATAVAPFVGMKFAGRPVVEVIEDYASLAEALGGDVESPEVTEAKAAFDERLDTLRGIAAEKPLTILPLNGAEELWVGQKNLGQLALLEELGFTIGGPQDQEAWAELSWERVPDYPADVVLSYTGSDEAMAANPVYAGLPAVQAGQVVGWDDKRPFTYASYVEWFDELIAVLDGAEVVSGTPAS
ncbi:ABC transporter substrate-binding protein [Cellulosimicrobium sp. SH8]|uniref:ABC transporter substrate-binding protein n=1 Tax=Cellulosimicrobium sp. SH8 TaxID=2952936 RepID=UPI0021F29CFD|nr:ABC transporter substrate-binding protein [Cellulosimicrobium sp. SH8]